MEKNYLLHKWLNNEASPEERKQLEEDPEYASHIKIANLSSRFELPDMDVDSNLKAILEKRKHVRHINNNTIFSYAWKVAAFLAVVFATYYYTTTLDTMVESKIAQTETFLLPDNSEVVLNSGSKITYNKKRWNTSRELSLEGEAHFNVAKGNKFSVATVEGIVSVLGTKFNVRAREGALSVSCYEGLVSVAFADTVLQVSAGNEVYIKDGKLALNREVQQTSPTWFLSESSFRNESLTTVIKELERQYPIKVTLENVNFEKKFTGSFTHSNLDLALQAICEPLNLQYKLGKKGIVYINAKNSN
ncbi:FecR family protein [Aequorivita echinoideorum]|uniref:FecR domain-containing protein n=1 Tax=Aequorivita echinoideorum TaxID=1549647 RepID=A0ABS5S4R9_9FLAO|nr:FecR family protein [Aequorivita echinoideorum]MBT0607394.1 FecR domain-containing protein [Aequorivita echinoideorum]